MELLASLIIVSLSFINIQVDTIPLFRGEHGLLIVPCSFEIDTFKKSGNCLYDTGANLSVISDIHSKELLSKPQKDWKVLTLQSAVGESKTYSFRYTTLTSGNLTHKAGQYIFAPMPADLLGIVGSPLVNNRRVLILKDKIVVL